MSSYRRSSFEPNHWQPMGPPVRPYNWVQWIGVALIVAGLGVFLAYAAGRLGWIPKVIHDPLLITTSTTFGIILISSRREPVSEDRWPELRRKHRRAAAIALAVALVAAIIGFAAAYFSKGA